MAHPPIKALSKTKFKLNFVSTAAKTSFAQSITSFPMPSPGSNNIFLSSVMI